MAFMPEDRKRQSLLLESSVRENLLLAVLEQLSRCGFRVHRAENDVVARSIRDLHIAAATPDVTVGTLSGGNQQKVVMGKWLAAYPEILILDEPTRGIDVQAKAQVIRILEDLASKGLAIIFISSEIEEVLLVSHRILTMARGRIVSDQPVPETDLEQIMLSAVA
jgi:ABC-type sugar transport system ATPase subunit